MASLFRRPPDEPQHPPPLRRLWFRARAALIVASTMAMPPASAQSTFPQGVASGDVTEAAAILWTRRTTPGPVRMEMAPDEQFHEGVTGSTLQADESADDTVKFEASGLRSATTYYYRFIAPDTGEISPVGRFRTAPATDAGAAFRFVYSGDSNAADQPFHLLGFAADENPDLWFWAGDTIYGDIPANGASVATDVSGYHAKHRQNRDDPFLQTLLARCPVWAQWDDHEVANDYDGADPEPHIARERIVAGQRAFLDYMPIRPQNIADDPRRIYRSFRYGSLAEFFILDCRQYRSADLFRQGAGPDPRAFILPLPEPLTIFRLQDPSRTMLGKDQLIWLKAGLKDSTARWKFILSSVPFTSLLVLPYDRWDGYEAERYDLLRFIDQNGLTGVVLLSTDIHANVYNPDITRFQRERLGAAYSPFFAVPEFVAGPIATETFRQEVRNIGSLILGTTPAELDASLFLNLNFGLFALKIVQENRLGFVEFDRYAYLVVDVAADGLTLNYRGIPPDPTQTDPTLQTLYSVTLPDPQAGPCAVGLPIPLIACLCLLTAANRTTRTATVSERSRRRM